MPRHSTILAREIRSIRHSFNRLASSFGRLGPMLTKSAAEARKEIEETKSMRRRPRLTDAQRRALKLQGKYMGTMRGLKPADRAKIKRIRVERGIRAAIQAAQRMAS